MIQLFSMFTLRRTFNQHDPTWQNKVLIVDEANNEIASKVEFDIAMCHITWVHTYTKYTNMGFARWALSDALEWFKSSPCKKITMSISPHYGTDYNRLLRFYQSVGFIPSSLNDKKLAAECKPCRLHKYL